MTSMSGQVDGSAAASPLGVVADTLARADYARADYARAVLIELERLILTSIDSLLASIPSDKLAIVLEINERRFSNTEAFEQYRKWDIEAQKCAVLVYASLFRGGSEASQNQRAEATLERSARAVEQHD